MRAKWASSELIYARPHSWFISVRWFSEARTDHSSVGYICPLWWNLPTRVRVLDFRRYSSPTCVYGGECACVCGRMRCTLCPIKKEYDFQRHSWEVEKFLFKFLVPKQCYLKFTKFKKTKFKFLRQSYLVRTKGVEITNKQSLIWNYLETNMCLYMIDSQIQILEIPNHLECLDG
jgi:hypothetical protein